MHIVNATVSRLHIPFLSVTLETFLTEQQTDNCSSWHHTENLNFFLSSFPLLEVVDSEKAKNCLKDFTARNILVFL